MRYESSRVVESAALPGVRFTVRRMSYGRRSELIARMRDLMRRAEFHEASPALDGKAEASLLAMDVDKLYLEWGLAQVDGIEIDGLPATAASLIASGPEELCREIAQTIKAECGLDEEERKN
ncbi:MAG: hypothetical protein FJW40_08755 [Acidobacteria bacterium]|nr:hypothetical protein [Acidobacteriota bacterium]